MSRCVHVWCAMCGTCCGGWLRVCVWCLWVVLLCFCLCVLCTNCTSLLLFAEKSFLRVSATVGVVVVAGPANAQRPLF